MKKIICSLALIATSSFAGTCELTTYSADVAVGTSTIALSPRGSSGSLGDGYSFVVLDIPGAYVVRMRNADGVFSEAVTLVPF